jgi:site-specific recombinase
MYGISVRLTHLTLRLEQHLQRVKTILAILQAQTRESEQNNTIAFCKEIVRSESQKYSIQQHFSDNLSLLSRKIIENTSKVGQHYITAGRTEYWNMCKSAVGGGAVVAFLCCLKVYVYYQHFPPFGEAFFYSMVYSLGFIFIYLFHFTLATKQPAMTASTIAASIAENSINGKNHDKSVNLLIEISRSQFISLIGNVIMAFPMAYLLGIGYYWITGEHFATPEKAAKMIAEIHPTQSGSLFFAFIAGIFLMTSGLIAGYYQNKAKYENFGERLKKHPFLIFFAQRSNKFTRIADYLADNLGGLASNFYLGIFLGSMSTIGFIVGLDLDIRHVTFSSASFGLALVGLENTMSLQQVIVTVGGIVGIGIVNVTTSFGLSILIALKSNNVSLKDTFGLFVELIARFFKNPLPFFLPPRK